MRETKKVLSNLPVDYLKYLFKSKDSEEVFKIDGKNVYEDTRGVF